MSPPVVGDGGPLTSAGEAPNAQLATYTLPLLGRLMVESVVADVDATGGASRPVLRVRDKSGAVIATKRQGDTIPAGQTGSATWALRLDDEQAAAAATTRRYAWGIGATIALPHNTLYPFAPVTSNGIAYAANRWVIGTAGKYQITVTVSVQKAGPVAAGTGFGVFALKNAFLNIYTLSSQLPVAIPAGQTWEYHATIVAYATLNVGDTVFMASISGAGNVTLTGAVFGVVQVDG